MFNQYGLRCAAKSEEVNLNKNHDHEYLTNPD